jgi:acetyltransferase
MVGIEPSIPVSPGFLRLDYAAELAAACGIRVAPSVFAEEVGQVASLSERLDFPVAVKLSSPDLIHKTAGGGVRLAVTSANVAAEVARDMVHSDGSVSGDDAASVDGILIQSMQPTGVDVVVGAVRDRQFGPVVMFGAGGVTVEEERDVTFELAPVTSGDARRMLERTRTGRHLLRRQVDGGADIEAVLDTITRVAALIHQLDCVEEFEINPLRVFAQDHGAVALDVRCRRS